MRTELLPADPESDAVVMLLDGEPIGIAASPAAARETLAALRREIAAQRRRDDDPPPRATKARRPWRAPRSWAPRQIGATMADE